MRVELSRLHLLLKLHWGITGWLMCLKGWDLRWFFLLVGVFWVCFCLVVWFSFFPRISSFHWVSVLFDKIMHQRWAAFYPEPLRGKKTQSITTLKQLLCWFLVIYQFHPKNQRAGCVEGRCVKQRAVSVAAMGAGHHGMLRVEGVSGDGHTGGKPGGMSHFHQVSGGSRGLKGWAHLDNALLFCPKGGGGGDRGWKPVLPTMLPTPVAMVIPKSPFLGHHLWAWPRRTWGLGDTVGPWVWDVSLLWAFVSPMHLLQDHTSSLFTSSG